jgi:energy-coupling factor transporter transmembrane protein EcfT
MYAFLLMVSIAAFRVNFAPGAWVSNRYHPNVLLFVVSISIYWMVVAHKIFSQNWKKRVAGVLLVVFCLVHLMPAQYSQYKYAFNRANKTFLAQVPVLLLGPNQQNGRKLLTSIQEFDKIEAYDPFFRDMHAAYYGNKMVETESASGFVEPGSQMMRHVDAEAMANQCREVTTSSVIKPAEEQGLFNVRLDVARDKKSLLDVVPRNTYYLVSENGLVSGFVYPHIRVRENFYTFFLNGKSVNQSLSYVVEADGNGQPVCLYKIKT